MDVDSLFQTLMKGAVTMGLYLLISEDLSLLLAVVHRMLS
jgi:hypothetical protein